MKNILLFFLHRRISWSWREMSIRHQEDWTNYWRVHPKIFLTQCILYLFISWHFLTFQPFYINFLSRIVWKRSYQIDRNFELCISIAFLVPNCYEYQILAIHWNSLWWNSWIWFLSFEKFFILPLIIFESENNCVYEKPKQHC